MDDDRAVVDHGGESAYLFDPVVGRIERVAAGRRLGVVVLSAVNGAGLVGVGADLQLVDVLQTVQVEIFQGIYPRQVQAVRFFLPILQGAPIGVVAGPFDAAQPEGSGPLASQPVACAAPLPGSQDAHIIGAL